MSSNKDHVMTPSPEHHAESDRPPKMVGTQNHEVVAYWIERAYRAEAALRRPHVPWHEALSRVCWCGTQHHPIEAFEMNARVHIDGTDRAD